MLWVIQSTKHLFWSLSHTYCFTKEADLSKNKMVFLVIFQEVGNFSVSTFFVFVYHANLRTRKSCSVVAVMTQRTGKKQVLPDGIFLLDPTILLGRGIR